MVQRGNEISYLEPGLEPFTNMALHLDSLPSSQYVQTLFPHYDFISVGRTRIADRLLSRVVARDGTTASHMVGWTPNRNY